MIYNLALGCVVDFWPIIVPALEQNCELKSPFLGLASDFLCLCFKDFSPFVFLGFLPLTWKVPLSPMWYWRHSVLGGRPLLSHSICDTLPNLIYCCISQIIIVHHNISSNIIMLAIETYSKPYIPFSPLSTGRTNGNIDCGLHLVDKTSKHKNLILQPNSHQVLQRHWCTCADQCRPHNIEEQWKRPCIRNVINVRERERKIY